ncbi:glycosyl hydrolase [Sphingomonas sp. BK580]|uniref:glycosyl hydrolase n=1 Tax=Sphingomonas sp. BK580 TaxID=2586972 RepID=UPI00161FA490|nr:glycosyl hydrolase [Sphingomonas sp. BK580]MBB3695072.1 hypothetical protein [Sphingomonas sp. BK580]
MTQLRPLVPLAAAFLLAGCGGGGGPAGVASAVVVAPSAAPVVTPTPIPAPTPTPPPAPAATPAPVATPVAAAPGVQSVVYVGNDVPDLAAYEAWLGRETDGVQLFSGRNGWADWSDSIGWLADRWKNVARTHYWSIPLFAEGGTLAAAAAGDYDSRWRAAAAALLANSPGDSTIAVRTGWEFNGDWQPWAAKGKEADYRAAYRRFVASFRGVSGRFRFEWTPNLGDFGTNPEDSYPGDDVVDLIGMDFYYKHEWDPADPVAAFNYKVSERYGLAWHQDFAARHGKPTAYAEWGVSRDSDAPYVTLALAWFAAHKVVYASYWNSNADYSGKLSDNQYPLVASAYRTLLAGK